MDRKCVLCLNISSLVDYVNTSLILVYRKEMYGCSMHAHNNIPTYINNYYYKL